MTNHCTLGDLIKNQLSLMGKNQNWLAEQCNVTRGQISHIVVGRSNPSIKMLGALSAALNLECETLIEASLKH